MQHSPTPVVALVDNDASVRRSMTNLLRSAGMPIETYGSAEELLAQAQLSRVGCVVLDLHLREMNGLDLALALSALDPGLPFVFLTAETDPTTRERCLAAGAVAVVAKPFAAEELLHTLRAAMRTT